MKTDPDLKVQARTTLTGSGVVWSAGPGLRPGLVEPTFQVENPVRCIRDILMYRIAAFLLVLAPSSAVATEPVDFERHVIGLLGKSGCSAGACHGSFQGKGGLRLSLFGSEPTADYLALTRGAGGRRINPTDPDASLLLLKATGQVSHGGGTRFAVGSWQYRVLPAWVAAGGRHTPGTGTVVRLDVSPAEHVLATPGTSARLSVRAAFADGTEADVTPFCALR